MLSDTPNNRATTFVRASALLALGAILGLALAPRASSRAEARVRGGEVDPVQCPAPPQTPAPARVAPNAASPTPTPLPRNEPQPSEEARLLHAKAATRELTNRLRKRVHLAERFLPNRDPQEVLAEVLPYVQGMADALDQIGPEYAEDVAAEIEQSLCGEGNSDAERLVMVRLAATSPDLGTGRGYDCVFARAESSPPILNTAIEAWRASGLPRTDALEDLARANPEHRLRIEGAQQRMRLQESNLMAEETERNNP